MVAKLIAKKRVLELTWVAESTTTIHAQTLQARDAVVSNLKEQVDSLKKKVKGAECEDDGVGFCLQQLRSGQKNHQSSVRLVQVDSSALAAWLEKDIDYLMDRRDMNCKRNFCAKEGSE